MRVAAKTADFEVAVPGIERVAENGRWLRRTLEAEHALVPSDEGELVGVLAGFRCRLCRRPNRSPVNAFAKLVAHHPSKRVQPPGANRPLLASGRLPDHNINAN